MMGNFSARRNGGRLGGYLTRVFHQSRQPCRRDEGWAPAKYIVRNVGLVVVHETDNIKE